MSQLNTTSWEALYGTTGTVFPDNTSGEISEGDMRTFGKNLSDSFLNRIDDAYTGIFPQATASGTDIYTATLNPAIINYSTAMKVQILFTNANTGASTLDLNGVGGKNIHKNGSTTLSAGDIAAGQILILAYDGTDFQIIGSPGSGGGGGGAVDSVNGQVGTVTLDAGDIANTPAGNISGVTVQAAINELDSEIDTRISAAIAGLRWKDPVRVATTVNGTLGTAYENGDTVDGVVLATGNRILIKNQTTQTENGVYIVAASGAPTRATDADTGVELEGAAVSVQEGTSNANTTWNQTTDSVTIGVSNIVWGQFGSSVPDADATTKGIARLYPSTSLGSNTDGAPTQNAAKVYIDSVVSGAVNGKVDALVSLRTETASYTLDATDLASVNAGDQLVIMLNVASANNLTIPLNATQAFPTGTVIGIRQIGAGQTTIVATGGVTLNAPINALKISAQFGLAFIEKTATNTWYANGELTL